MTPEEYITAHELCLKECELSDSSEFVTMDVAIKAVEMAREEEKKLACKVFKQQCTCIEISYKHEKCDGCWKYMDFVKIINM